MTTNQAQTLYVKSLFGDGPINVWTNTNTVFVGTNVNSVGAGESIIDNVGPGQIDLKSVVGSGGIVVNTSGNALVISGGAGSVTLTTPGTPGTTNLVVNSVGPNLVIKDLAANGMAQIFDETNVVTFFVPNVTLTSGAGGQNLVLSGFGPNLEIMPVEGQGMANVSNVANVLVINVPNVTLVGGGTLLGENLVISSESPDLSVKDLVAGNGIILDGTANAIEISANFEEIGREITLSTPNAVITGTGQVAGLVSIVAGAGGLIGGLLDGPNLEVLGLAGNGGTTVTQVNLDFLGIGTGSYIEISSNVYSVSNVGSGQGLVANASPDYGPNFWIKSIQGNAPVVVTSNADTVFVNVNTEAILTNVNLSTSGNGNSLVVVGGGPNLVIKSLFAGTGINIDANSNPNTLVIETNVQLVSVGGGVSLVPAPGVTKSLSFYPGNSETTRYASEPSGLAEPFYASTSLYSDLTVTVPRASEDPLKIEYDLVGEASSGARFLDSSTLQVSAGPYVLSLRAAETNNFANLVDFLVLVNGQPQGAPLSCAISYYDKTKGCLKTGFASQTLTLQDGDQVSVGLRSSSSFGASEPFELGLPGSGRNGWILTKIQ